jgi:hypothetical protein
MSEIRATWPPEATDRLLAANGLIARDPAEDDMDEQDGDEEQEPDEEEEEDDEDESDGYSE